MNRNVVGFKELGALVEMKKFVTLNIKVPKKEKRNIYNRKLTIYLIYYAYAEYLFSFLT